MIMLLFLDMKNGFPVRQDIFYKACTAVRTMMDGFSMPLVVCTTLTTENAANLLPILATITTAMSRISLTSSTKKEQPNAKMATL